METWKCYFQNTFEKICQVFGIKPMFLAYKDWNAFLKKKKE